MTAHLHVAAQLLPKFCLGVKKICARSDSLSDVERAILRYLVEHPLAKDTAAGIVHWWLPDLLPPPPEIAVQRALDALVQQDWVVETKKSPTMTLYGLKESRREEILESLDD